MLFRSLIVVAGCLALPILAGCSDRNELSSSPIYNTCFDVQNCVPTADLCEVLTVDFAGVSYENAICTVECETEGAVAEDCPRAFVGRNGSCYPSSVGGGVDDTLVCFEPCNVDGDCLCGFRCLTAEDLCPPSGAPCPITDGDAICLPGPNDCLF